jgi:hypothetical protein
LTQGRLWESKYLKWKKLSLQRKRSHTFQAKEALPEHWQLATRRCPEAGIVRETTTVKKLSETDNNLTPIARRATEEQISKLRDVL